jgi:hypothetical protein
LHCILDTPVSDISTPSKLTILLLKTQRDKDQLKNMSPSHNDKNTVQTDVASIRSTSTMSSLKALLPKKSEKKPKPSRPRESLEEKSMRREATYAYFATR